MILVCVKPLNIITPIVMAAVSILSILKKYLTNGINIWVKDLVCVLESGIHVLSRTIFSLKSKALVVLGGLFDKSRNYHMGGAKEEHEWKHLLPDAWGVMAKI